MSRSRLTPWLAGPALAYLVIFSLVPTAMVLSYSFYARDYYGEVKPEFSLEAWRLAVDGITLRILGRSLVLALCVTLIDLLVAYPVVMALMGIGKRRRGMFIVLLSFPLVTSLLLRIYGWLNLLPLEWRGELPAVALVMAVNYLPFMILPLLRAFERAEANLVHAAMDLGATPWQAFWRVTFPITRPGMWAGCALVFIPCSGEYLVPHFIGEGRVIVIGKLIIHEFMSNRNWPYAAACAVWLVLIVLLPVVFSLFSRTPSTATMPAEFAAEDARTKSA
jgi:ABC-type spermidine/putrescine transport system permease subunit I